VLKGIFCAAILLAAVSVKTTKAASNININVIFNYDIFSEGTDVGNMKVQIKEISQGGYEILEHSLIQAKAVWGEVSLQTKTSEQYSAGNSLISANIKTYDKNQVFWTTIDNFGADLSIHFSAIKSPPIKEQEAPFKVLDTTIPKNSYHTTLAHLPKYWSIQQQKLPGHLNLLDFKSLSVVRMYIEDKGLEVREYRSAKIPTRHYTLISENNEPLNIWLAVNENNIAYLFQLQGKDEYGDFTIQVKP